MRSRLIRIVAVGVVTSFILSGCMLSRGVDRAFLGWGVRYPAYENRKGTGILLLPISFALDVVTLPVQALLVVIFGDSFPFRYEGYSVQANALNGNPQFQKLSNEQKTLALAELKGLLRSGTMPVNTALVLCEDGHWIRIKINDKQRAQLLARSQTATRETLAFVQ